MNKKGFSIIEVLMAMAVVATIVLFCFTVFSSAYDVIQYTQGDMTAVQLAQRQMEFFRTSFIRVPPVGGPYDYNNVPEDYNNVNLNPTVIINGKEFKTEVTVYEVDSANSNLLRRVVVKVTRNEGKSRRREVVIESLISSNE